MVTWLPARGSAAGRRLGGFGYKELLRPTVFSCRSAPVIRRPTHPARSARRALHAEQFAQAAEGMAFDLLLPGRVDAGPDQLARARRLAGDGTAAQMFAIV